MPTALAPAFRPVNVNAQEAAAVLTAYNIRKTVETVHDAGALGITGLGRPVLVMPYRTMTLQVPERPRSSSAVTSVTACCRGFHEIASFGAALPRNARSANQ